MSESYSNSNHGGESVESSNYGNSKYSSSSYRKPASESVEDRYTYQQSPSSSPSSSLSISQIKDFLRKTEKGIRDYCSREKVSIDYNDVTNLFKYIIVDNDKSLIKNPTLQHILVCVDLHSSQNPSQKEIYTIISSSLKEQIKDEQRNTSQLKYW